MRWFAPILLIAALVSANTAAAQNSALKRLTLRQDLLGWEAVGRVELGGGYCTGVLIANDLVLTAAHCVYDRSTGARRDVTSMQFRSGLGDGASIADRDIAQVVAHPNYAPGRANGARNVRHDVALLKLSSPISSGVASPFRIQDFTRRQGRVSVVSYAQGRSDALSREAECGVLGLRRDLLAFDCDVYFGSSGAPVFDLSGGRARIVSIISSGSRSESGSISFGMQLPKIVADLKMAFRTGKGVWPKTTTTSRRISVGTKPNDTGARFLRP
jgi:protease YdgD